MQILFLCNRPTANSQAATVTEYLDALVTHSKHTVHEISMMGRFPSQIDLNRFDAVILHYSLSMGPMINHYLGEDFVQKLTDYKGLKAAFLQDEYRAIQMYWRNIRRLKINILFSCVPEDEITKVYPPSELPGVQVINVLTGYVSQSLTRMSVPPIAERALDAGYRSRQPQFWLGAFGWEKTLICTEFYNHAKSTGLRVDASVSEGDRLYGQAWIDFILSCRALLGTESGASIIDFDGQLEKRVDEYVAAHPGARFDAVSDLFLKEYEGSLRLHQISPRCFEAAALRTPMVLFEGHYSGVLEADRHYISLKKDFSNFEEVAAKLKDTDALQAMADRTYQEIALNTKWGYPAFIKRIDAALEAKSVTSKYEATTPAYQQAEFSAALRRSLGYYLRRRQAVWLQSILLGLPWTRKALFKVWFALPLTVQRKIRPLTKLISR